MAGQIDFYAWYTSNAKKVLILLEETGLAYDLRIIDIGRGDQFTPEFLAISPNNKIPAIVDHDGPNGSDIPLFESGAILIYLAEKTGRFLPADPVARYRTLQWLMFQMGGVGPMFGQANHFLRYAKENIPYAMDRYTKECGRLYQVMNKQLASNRYLAGDDYTIADMATVPWARSFDWRGQNPDDVPHVKRWVDEIEVRPAVQRAYEILSKPPRSGPIDDEHWENMYGETQYKHR